MPVDIQNGVETRESRWLWLIGLVSILVTAVVALLILGPRPEGMKGSFDVSHLPTVNAVLNGLSGTFLLTGFVLIKQGKKEAHRKAMLAAFACSVLFLLAYVTYHWFSAGPAKYMGSWVALYYSVLISHIVLAAGVVPLALVTLYFALTGQLGRHRRLAVVTFPVWFYVSVSGVVVYVMLYV